MPNSKEIPILSDLFEPTLSPIFYFKPAFCFPDGILSPLDRVRRQKRDDPVRILSKRDQAFFDLYFRDQASCRWELIEKNNVPNHLIKPSNLIYRFEEKFHQDLHLLDRKNFPILKKVAFFFEGILRNVWLHPSVKIPRSTFLDLTGGPIMINKNVKISPFSHLRGPLYIGEGSLIHNADISHSRIGRHCRIGGEVSHSLIGDYTNKSHAGFLGHSIVGDWVNLGALTTTSDLKNNYGQVRLHYKEKIYETKEQKFGSIIGDLSRTGIGTMLNTGTILDIGTCLFEGRPVRKYYPAFFWGGKPDKYGLDRFIDDLGIIMARRDQSPSKEYVRKIRERYLI